MFRLVFFLALFLGFTSNAQTFKFNHFQTKNGLSQDFVYTINQDNNGYLWIGTGEGLNRFDGKKITIFNQKDGLSENIIISSFKDSDGVIWYGHNDGTITKLNDNKFEKISTLTDITSSINAIEKINDQLFFISQNEGVFIYQNNIVTPIGKFNQDLFYSLKVIDENTIFVGGNMGLLLIQQSEKGWVVKQTINDIEATSIILNTKNQLIVGTNMGELLFVDFNLNQLKSYPVSLNFTNNSPIKRIVSDVTNGDIWVATAGAGIIKITGLESEQENIEFYNESKGLVSDYIQTIFIDRESNIWIGTFGAGLLSLTDDHFAFYNHLQYKDVRSIYTYKNTKWFGTNNGLIELLPNDSMTVFDGRNQFVDAEISDLQLFDSILWIGTYSNGLYQYNLSTQKFKKISWDLGGMQNRINDIFVEKNRVWIGTNGGLIIYDVNAKTTNILTTEDGLDHNAIESIYKAKDGKVYLGTFSRNLFVIENSSIQEIEIIESGELLILDIDESSNGDLWLATAEQGVFKLSQDSIFSYTTLNGLLSNYCYSIEADGNDKIWIGHRNGISKLDPEDNNKITIYDSKNGINSQVNKGAMFLDESKYLWIGTEDGVIRFDSKNDLIKETPPLINFSKVTINDEVYPITEVIELPYSTYRINLEFIGVSLKDPDNILYQYMLEGYDEDFSKPSKENFATYSKLQDGDYIFKVKAFSKSNKIMSKEIKLTISIAKPFWKKWWFFVLCVLVIGGVVYSFFWFKIRRLQRQKKTIQKQLDIKTKQVVESAKKIEVINRDLMSSINYALKLQNSILPPKENVNHIFPGSFIYYKPRNVVSGDFYFLNECNKKIIFACVDCTGHGVPGAFMSLIGYVALRDIYRMNEAQDKWQTPDQILESLDREIKDLLETHSVDKNTNNGMDMILCEYNTETKELLVASAKRPIVIYNEGELKIVKGEKRSIGEQDFGLIIPYQLHKFDIKPNDVIYMFSDGFTDQFGGPNTKKFGIRKTIKTIDELKTINPKQQQKYIIETFEDWKQNHSQTDDIIFMGVYF